MRYLTKGTCSRAIELEIEGDVIKAVQFEGGCRGNQQGIAALAKDKKVDEVIAALEGIQCRNGTSCPDQLAQALKAYKAERDC